jgi:hypothetical protein
MPWIPLALDADMVAEVEAAVGHHGTQKSFEQSDPFFLFARGLSFYQDAHFDLAASELARAHAAMPDSPAILAWLARAYLTAERRAPGEQAFRELQATARSGSGSGSTTGSGTGTPLVADLQRRFPFLRDLRPD